MILQSYAFLTAVLPEVTLGSCSQPSPILRQRFVALPACELPTHLRLLLLSTVLSILDEQDNELCTVITYEEALGLCGLQEAFNET